MKRPVPKPTYIRKRYGGGALPAEPASSNYRKRYGDAAPPAAPASSNYRRRYGGAAPPAAPASSNYRRRYGGAQPPGNGGALYSQRQPGDVMALNPPLQQAQTTGDVTGAPGSCIPPGRKPQRKPQLSQLPQQQQLPQP